MTDSSAANVLLLVLLYAIQGIPLGLSLGSVPFLLRNVASYTDVGIFTFASYPYSLKLFWSPIVDSIFIKWLGRRKSWIIPIQLVVGCIFIVISGWMDEFMAQQQSREQVVFLTVVFFFIVFLVATQDIAGLSLFIGFS
jgi:phage-related holin